MVGSLFLHLPTKWCWMDYRSGVSHYIRGGSYLSNKWFNQTKYFFYIFVHFFVLQTKIWEYPLQNLSFYSSSSSSALQLFMSFGLLSNFVPLLPLLRSLFPVLVPKYIFSFLFLITRFGRLLSIRPAFNNWAFLAVFGFFFSGARLLALRPTPNLEGRGVSLRLASTLWPVRLGWPYQ